MIGYNLKVRGRSFAYWLSGQQNSSKPAVLLIHGFGGTYSGLEMLSSELEKSHAIVGIDLPGYGQSAPLHGRHTLRNYAEFLDTFCRETQFHKFDVVAHSFGADVAIVFAALYPHRIRRLVLLNPVLASSRPGIRLGILYYKLIELAPKKFRHHLIHNHLLTRLTDYVNFEHATPTQKAHVLRNDYISDHLMSDRASIESYHSLLSTNFAHMARRIRNETLIISGKADKLSPEKDMQILQAAVPHASLLILPREGHFMPIESPNLTFRHIEPFLDS